MTSKGSLDRSAVNDFVASAKMNETTFSRAGGDVLQDRIIRGQDEIDERFGKNRNYMDKYDKGYGSPGVRRRVTSAPK